MKTAVCLKKMHSKWLEVGNNYEVVKEIGDKIVIAIRGTVNTYPRYGFTVKDEAPGIYKDSSKPAVSAPYAANDHVAQINKAISERIESLHVAMMSGDEEGQKTLEDIKVLAGLKKELEKC